MRQEVFMAGIGGQGVQLAGQILAEAALEAGLELSWFPLYSPEVRGGPTTCTLVIADGPVGSPVVGGDADMILMDRAAVAMHLPGLRPGGLVVINSSLAGTDFERDDVKIVAVPANEIAAELGSERAVNMVLLGAFVGATGVVARRFIERALHKVLPERYHEYIPLNMAALQRGAELVAEQTLRGD